MSSFNYHLAGLALKSYRPRYPIVCIPFPREVAGVVVGGVYRG